jgi:hypothetical protein
MSTLRHRRARTPPTHHYRVEAWVARATLPRMLDWCGKNVAEGWDYQQYTEALLSEHAIAVRFYFVNAADAAAFEEMWIRHNPLT